MRYCSTRGGDRGVPFERTLLAAYATDGGLFVPEKLPNLSRETLIQWAPLKFAQVAARVMQLFTDLPLVQLDQIAAEAFATFNGGQEPPLPLSRDAVHGVTLLDAGQGPTLSFKDVGQQVVARLLGVYLPRSGEHANIIVETSGDTGPAAIAGIANSPHADIFVLYPHGRISPVQELQMITWGGTPNVHVFRTEGDTDEQAEALKLLFADKDFMSKHRVISINSINWARVMVQSSYYVWAYLQLRPDVDGPVHFVIPTGAFGNAVGGLVARCMGLPIGRIVCATNSNDVVHRTISDGDLSIGANVETISPAMDIQFAYNVERMLYFISGGDTAKTAHYMSAAQQRRPERLPPDLLGAIQSVFVSAAVDDERTCKTMRDAFRTTGFVLDPHSAVGVHAATSMAPVREALQQPPAPVVCVLTAHPAKFESALIRAGIPPAQHPSVDALKKKAHAFTWLRKPAVAENKLVAWAAAVRGAVEARAALRQRSSAGQGLSVTMRSKL